MAALDPSAAQAAMANLVQAGAAGAGGAGAVPSAAAESAVAANLIRAIPPTRVLVMLNMVTEAELTDPQEYEVSFWAFQDRFGTWREGCKLLHMMAPNVEYGMK